MVDERDALQAVIAAMRYGEDIGLASHNAWSIELDGGSELVTMHPGYGETVIVSLEAAELVRKAHMRMSDGLSAEYGRYGTCTCDLREL